MAIDVAEFEFTANTTTGNQTIATGLGFTPKGYILFTVYNTSNATFQEGSYITMGFCDGTNSGCNGCASVDAAATSSSGGWYANEVIRLGTPSAPASTIDAIATHSSFGSGTIVINWSDAPASAIKFYGIAFGGADFSCEVGIKDMTKSGTGTQAYTTTLTNPTCLLTMVVDHASAPPNQTTHASFALGVATATTKRGLVSIALEDGRTAMDTWRLLDDTKCCGCVDDSTGALLCAADLSSFDSGGFTLNWTTAPPSTTDKFYYMVMKGGNYDCGTVAKRTTTGDTVVTPSSIGTLKGLMLFSNIAAKSSTVGSTARLSIGLASSTTAEGGAWIGNTDAAADDTGAKYSDDGNILVMATEAATATSSTKVGIADLSAFGTNTFTLTYSVATAVTGDIFWWVIGEVTTQAFNGDITESAITIDQTLARTLAALRSPSESAITVNQTLERILGALRAPSESAISVNQTIERILGALRSISESAITVNQTILGERSVPRSISEEAISIDQTLTRILGAIRSPPETTNVNQTLVTLLDAIRTINESSVNSNETLARILGALRTISETAITTDDSVTGIKILLREITETAITINQTITTLLAATRPISEPSITIDQSLTATILFVRSINENAITINDSLIRLLGAIRNPIEDTTINDALARLIQVTMAITEPSITINDASTRIAGYLKTINEPSISTNDSIATLLEAIRSIAESAITIDQTLTRIQGLTKTINEGAININQTIEALRASYANIIEVHIKWYYSLLTYKGGGG